MIVNDVLMALAVALLVTLIFSAVLRTRGPWASAPVFFVLVFLASWAGGLWITPFGPPVFGIYWLPFLAVGALCALLLAVIPGRRTQSRKEAIQQIRAQEMTTRVLSGLMWIMIVGLILVIAAAYLA
jgi:hypothetical protein